MDRCELLIGCGSSRVKKMGWEDRCDWQGLLTLDVNPAHKPDIVHDLCELPYPLADNSCDEIHAYDVLEHTGQQGDWRFFFAQWSEFYRILKPGGLFLGISPHWSSPWAWGDPGHTRIMAPECLTFLDQEAYKSHVGSTPMTDYRFVFEGDFEILHLEMVKESRQSLFVLKAVKPSRIRRTMEQEQAA